jgi:predicted transporter
MAMGVAIMSIIALGMILGGIYTTKQWLSHENDVSRRTFLWLSLPCPVCFTAIFLACMMLSTVAGISNLAIGIIIGTFFFVVIAGTSFVAQKTGSSPATLGNAMIFIGLFYMLSMLIIPAYLQAQTVNSPEFCFPLDELLISFSVMLVIVFLGFISHRRRLKWKYHPV